MDQAPATDQPLPIGGIEEPAPFVDAPNVSDGSNEVHSGTSPEAETCHHEGRVAYRAYTTASLKGLETEIGVIHASKGQESADASDATLRVLKVALDGSSLQDVPPVGQDSEFRAWVASLRPVFVSVPCF